MAVPLTDEFVVVTDVLGTLRYRFGIKEAETNQNLRYAVNLMEDEFCERLQRMTESGTIIRKLDASTLTEKLLVAIRRIGDNPVVVCLDRSYLPDTQHLDPTLEYGSWRIVAHINFPSLEVQADKLNERLKEISLLRGRAETEVVLVDVGINEGRTLTRVIDLLEERQIKIGGIICGLGSSVGEKTIEARGYKVTAVEPETWKSWIDSRDLFLIDGIQEPERFRGGNYRRYVPLMDIMDRDDGFGIRSEQKGAFRDLCMEMNSRLLNLLKNSGIDTTIIGRPLAARLENTKIRSLRNR